MTGPGDEIAAAGRGHMRASDADREQVIGTLKAAFVSGRLAKDELDLRVGQAFTARTYAELGALTADLPAGDAAGRLLRVSSRARGWPPLNNGAKAAAGVVVAVTMVTVALWLVAWFAGNGALLATAILATGIDVLIMCAATAQLLEARHHGHSGRPLPPSARRPAKRSVNRWPGQDALCVGQLAPNARSA